MLSNLSPGLLIISGILALALLAIVVLFFYLRREHRRLLREAEEIRSRVRDEVESMRRNADLEAKEELFRLREEFEQETKEERQKTEKIRGELQRRERELDKQATFLHERLKTLEGERDEGTKLRQRLQEEESKLATLLQEHNEKLAQISGLTIEDALAKLQINMEDQARQAMGRRLLALREEYERQAKKESQRITTMALQRYAGDHSANLTVSIVELPDDEMKGRIIGRDGRNIRSFEQITGVDLIIDDTPEAVILSCFNPWRREIARLSLEELIRDGRIHPTRIEEIVSRIGEELESRALEIGEEVLFDLDIRDLHPDLATLIGKLQYRNSYGQNTLQHSQEVALLCGFMAEELGLDAEIARRAGLLHDIGKAIDQEVEGTHAALGAQIATQYGESPVVINAIAGHHEEVEATHLMTWLTSAADAISGARPGARKETLDHYVGRIVKLEDIASAFPGVMNAYAIQAGREVRVLVNSQLINDEQAALLSFEIARKIESDLVYPGEVRVVVIRETRATDTAS
ncbi:MAG: ribonuclease Y [bacterium]|nr:ribonuclease Y [bacterium]